MKKLLILLLSFTLSIILIGCGNTSQSSTSSSETETQDENGGEDEESINTEGSDVLVAYFSQTGNTQRIAETISADLNANLFQILPEEAYTEADLDYNADSSRSKTESEDNTIRPAIDGTVEDMDKFSYVFIGYPIWYGEAPRVIDTFLESYNFSGKTIIPFCTSNSSPIGESASNLEGLAPSADWLDGTRFASDASSQEVTDWVNSLDIKTK